MTNSFRAQKKFIDIDGRQLAYIEKGSGDPIVLLLRRDAWMQHAESTQTIPHRRICGETLFRNSRVRAV